MSEAMAVDGEAAAPPQQPGFSLSTPETVQAAQQAAVNVHNKLSKQAAPVRQYLESTVVPILMQGMQAVCRERPDDPVQFLAYYLLQHNPKGPHVPSATAAGTTAAGAAVAGASAAAAAAPPAAS